MIQGGPWPTLPLDGVWRFVGEDVWTIEARIPVAETGDDPLHEVVGRQPRENFPWFFTILHGIMGSGK